MLSVKIDDEDWLSGVSLDGTLKVCVVEITIKLVCKILSSEKRIVENVVR